MAALAFAMTPSASSAQEGEGSQSGDYVYFNETGETSRCVTYADITSFTAISDTQFFFVKAGEYYRNDTHSECTGATDPGMNVVFMVTSDKFCKNTLVNVYKPVTTVPYSSCRLGVFKKLTVSSAS